MPTRLRRAISCRRFPTILKKHVPVFLFLRCIKIFLPKRFLPLLCRAARFLRGLPLTMPSSEWGPRRTHLPYVPIPWRAPYPVMGLFGARVRLSDGQPAEGRGPCPSICPQAFPRNQVCCSCDSVSSVQKRQGVRSLCTFPPRFSCASGSLV